MNINTTVRSLPLPTQGEIAGRRTSTFFSLPLGAGRQLRDGNVGRDLDDWLGEGVSIKRERFVG